MPKIKKLTPPKEIFVNGIQYDSISEAARVTGRSRTHLSRRVKKKGIKIRMWIKDPSSKPKKKSLNLPYSHKEALSKAIEGEFGNISSKSKQEFTLPNPKKKKNGKKGTNGNKNSKFRKKRK